MAFSTVDDYVAFQRKNGKALGKKLRAEIGINWSEEKDVWKIMLTCSAAEIESGMELFRQETMQKYNRHPTTTLTEYINGSAH